MPMVAGYAAFFIYTCLVGVGALVLVLILVRGSRAPADVGRVSPDR